VGPDYAYGATKGAQDGDEIDPEKAVLNLTTQTDSTTTRTRSTAGSARARATARTGAPYTSAASHIELASQGRGTGSARSVGSTSARAGLHNDRASATASHPLRWLLRRSPWGAYSLTASSTRQSALRTRYRRHTTRPRTRTETSTRCCYPVACLAAHARPSRRRSCLRARRAAPTRKRFRPMKLRSASASTCALAREERARILARRRLRTRAGADGQHVLDACEWAAHPARGPRNGRSAARARVRARVATGGRFAARLRVGGQDPATSHAARRATGPQPHRRGMRVGAASRARRPAA
jgi:hypothetical protein